MWEIVSMDVHIASAAASMKTLCFCPLQFISSYEKVEVILVPALIGNRMKWLFQFIVMLSDISVSVDREISPSPTREGQWPDVMRKYHETSRFG